MVRESKMIPFIPKISKIHFIFSCIYFSNNICRLKTEPPKLGIPTKGEILNLPQTLWRTILKKCFSNLSNVKSLKIWKSQLELTYQSSHPGTLQFKRMKFKRLWFLFDVTFELWIFKSLWNKNRILVKSFNLIWYAYPLFKKSNWFTYFLWQ